MKPKIAFVTGGYSGEAEISYKTAITIQNNIDTEKFEAYTIDIRTDGWFYKDENDSERTVDKNDFSIIINDEKITFDGVLIGIHGTPGEDGKLQGYLDMLNIKYTSCDASTSALTFNKKYTVAVAASAGINVAKSIRLFKNDQRNDEELLTQLKLPVFVKPNNGGSSIGMSKVMVDNQLSAAIDKAFKEDDEVLVEELIKGNEFTIGVFRSQGQITPLPITQVISKKDFFDFEAKYLGASEEITPAKISESIAQQVRDAAVLAYKAFNCRGVVRIDFIYNEANHQPFMLEINTVPGQSEASIVPQQVKAMGWTLQQFYTALIEDCLSN
jgi:D-alanine-D-alanine ligase